MCLINILFPASTHSSPLPFLYLEALSHLIYVLFGRTQVLLCVISRTRDFLLLADSSDLITWTLSTLCGKPNQTEKYQLKSKLCGKFVRTVIKTMHLWLMLSICLIRYIRQCWVCDLLSWISLDLPFFFSFFFFLLIIGSSCNMCTILSTLSSGVTEHLWIVSLCEWTSQGT